MKTDHKFITKSKRKIYHTTFGLSWDLYDTTTHFLKGHKTLCGKTVMGDGWLKGFSEEVDCKQCTKIIKKKKAKEMPVPRQISAGEANVILPISSYINDAIQQRLFEESVYE